MSKIDKVTNSQWISLTPEEDVMAATNPSIWPILPQILFGVLVSVVGVYGALRIDTAFLGVSILGVFISLVAELQRRYRWYVLTEEQIYKKRGIINQNIDQARYDEVKNISLNLSFVERLLNYGDIKIYTSGTGESEFKMDNTPNARGFKAEAVEQLDIVRERGYYTSREDAEDISDGEEVEGQHDTPSN